MTTMTREQAKAFLKDNNIRYVLAQFVDIHGAAKTKAVPVAHFDSVLDVGAGFAGFAVWGMGITPNGPDYMARGDLNAVSLVPWQEGFARIVCDGHVHEKPWDYCSRVLLKKQVAKLAEQGLTFYTGLEPEFSVLRKTESGEIVPCDATDNLDKPCYDYKGLSRAKTYLDTLVQSAIVSGLDVYQIDHEDGNGQFEINYTYADCLSSADQFIGFKMMASEIAHEMGLICSFMPKPFSNRPGNGMHMHMSMGGHGQSNLFEDKSDPRGLNLSTMAYHFLGGVLKHSRALTAVCCPSVNSYKRLVVGRSLTGATWAPAYISYGDNNRSCMVRIPGGRLEMRVPDGGCNPYLATAAILAAGMDGVQNQIDPGDPVNENLYEWTPAMLKKNGIEKLPQNLNEAIDALEANSVVCEALGPAASTFIDIKRMEWVEYMRHVSDWELKTYLEQF